ncbi:hypothetical protein BAY61_26230 [Prauserella marina]|uniref:Uncharacterized protein n=1 Tax=Prauserella marina TaxID=530584 RepID=A0A222VVF2_9PSEU|nr:hypothetical protein [Prauserella marina]ASR37926.1 hypothetical protein BAY61_26230 [Prauserella marina]PWV73135.1 hypothetical protein DES30_10984 [Prauserella marina]SDD71010.1 hypothetical protein SAMN05421630_111189 [Prauserella marina]
MTSQPTAAAGYDQGAAPAPQRPGTLLAAIAVAVVGALASLVNGILMAVGAEDLFIDILASAAGVSAEEVSAVVPAIVLDEGVDTLSTRGTMALVVGVGLLVFGALLRGAAVWARVAMTVFALATVLVGGRVATDEGTGLMLGLGWLAVVGSIVAIVLAWLPANHRYAKALKAKN